MGSWDGRVGLVTGGASGIGLATVERLTTEGAAVVVADVNHTAGQRVADACGARFVHIDVADPGTWDDLVADIRSTEGGLDLAVLNAGVTTGEGDIRHLTTEQYRRVMGVNIDGVVFGTRASTAAMADSGGGAIVVTASMAGLMAFPPDPVYTLTKHAVVGLVRSLAPTLLPHGVTINAVCPGIVDTPLVGEEPRRLLGEMGFAFISPSEIADAIVGVAGGGGTGQLLVCTAGAEPVPYEFNPVIPAPQP